MKKLILLLVFLTQSFAFANGGDTLISKQDYLNLVSKITTLEQQVNEGNQSLKAANETLEVSKRYSETADMLVDRYYLVQTLLITITAFIVTLAGLLGFFGLRRYIKTELAKILHQKEETIVDLFKKHERERGILKNSRILIINRKDTDIDRNIEIILNKFQSKYSVETIADIINHTFENKIEAYDAVIFDNTNTADVSKNWNFDNNPEEKGSLIKIAENICSKNVGFIFFGTNDGKFAFELQKYSHLINFSNKPATLFANLINLLDFRMMLLSK